MFTQVLSKFLITVFIFWHLRANCSYISEQEYPVPLLCKLKQYVL